MESPRFPGGWRAFVPPVSPTRTGPPRPPGKWKAGWRILAEELRADQAAAGPAVEEPVWEAPSHVPRRNRADWLRRHALDPERLARISAELDARELARRRAVVELDQAAEELIELRSD